MRLFDTLKPGSEITDSDEEQYLDSVPITYSETPFEYVENAVTQEIKMKVVLVKELCLDIKNLTLSPPAVTKVKTEINKDLELIYKEFYQKKSHKALGPLYLRNCSEWRGRRNQSIEKVTLELCKQFNCLTH